jgi:hypothetical protein
MIEIDDWSAKDWLFFHLSALRGRRLYPANWGEGVSFQSTE